MALLSVAFRCAIRNLGYEGEHYTVVHTEFKLGPGPCGKVVEGLTTDRSTPGVLRITQTHEDLTYKNFYYPLVQIVGRVVEEREL